MAAGGIKIGSRRQGDSQLIEDLTAEGDAVIGQVTHIGVKIKGAVCRRQAIKSGARQVA